MGGRPTNKKHLQAWDLQTAAWGGKICANRDGLIVQATFGVQWAMWRNVNDVLTYLKGRNARIERLGMVITKNSLPAKGWKTLKRKPDVTDTPWGHTPEKMKVWAIKDSTLVYNGDYEQGDKGDFLVVISTLPRVIGPELTDFYG